MSGDVAELERPADSLADGWRSFRLGDVADISRGTSWGSDNERRDPVDGALPVLGIRNVQARLEIDDLLWLHGLKPSAIASSTVQTGDILMVGSNGNPARIGNAVQIDEPGRYLYASLLFGLRPRREAVDPDFLYFAVVAPGVQTAISDAVQGTTGLSNLKITTLRDLPIDLPPLDEQRRIAKVLRSVDEAIALERQCRDQAKTVRASLLQEHFHMGDWADGLPLPDGWQLPLLDSVAVRGSGHTPNKKMPEYWDGGIRWVSLQDTKRLDQVYIAATAQQISALGIDNSSAVLHPDGVVVISRDATVGRSAITVGPMAVSQHFIAYRCGPKLDNHYLYYWLQRMKPVFERIGAGSTIKTIGLPFFKGLRIALPPIEVQKQVAGVMLDVDLGIMACEQAIKSLSDMKANLMSDLLSGRVRVPA